MEKVVKIVNAITGSEIARILTNQSMTLDEAIKIVGEIFPANEEENVKIGENWYYYEELELIY